MKMPVIVQCFTVGLCFFAPHFLGAQNSTVNDSGRVIIVLNRFEVKGSDTGISGGLDSLIPQSLAVLLNESKTLGISAYFDEFGETTKIGDTVYVAQGDMLLHSGVVYVRGKVTEKNTGKLRFPFEANASKDRSGEDQLKEDWEILSERLYEDFVMGFARTIRIGIIEFKLVGGDTSFAFLTEAIPKMLSTYLQVSPNITLIEGHTEQLVSEIEKRKLEGIYDAQTAARYGRLMVANYLIMGQLWEYNKKMRIDVRCVNVESSEIIVSKGISFDTIAVKSIESKIAELASMFLTSIVKDLRKRKVENTIAVVVLSPLPNTANNRIRALHFARATSRKLRTSVSASMKVKEDWYKIELFLKQPADVWTMAATLDVDMLFAIQYENYEHGDITIDAELYDRSRPHTSVYSGTWCESAKDIDNVSDTIAVSLLRTLGIADSVIKKNEKERRGIFVRRIERPFSFGLRSGTVIASKEGPLENFQNQSFDIFYSFPLDRNHHWKMGPLVTWDWGNRTWENIFLGTRETSMHLLSCYLTMKYYFSPERSFNPYVGGGCGVLILRRIRSEEGSLLAAPGYPKFGVTILAGFEVFSNRHIFITTQAKVYRAFGRFEEDTYEGQRFSGGDMFGINLGLGIGFKW